MQYYSLPNSRYHIPVFGNMIDNAFEQAVMVSHRADWVALMADHHKD